MPKKVITNARKNAYTNELYEYIDAANLLFEPKELAIKELHPATIPMPAETIIKYSGKVRIKKNFGLWNKEYERKISWTIE